MNEVTITIDVAKGENMTTTCSVCGAKIKRTATRCRLCGTGSSVPRFGEDYTDHTKTAAS